MTILTYKQFNDKYNQPEYDPETGNRRYFVKKVRVVYTDSNGKTVTRTGYTYPNLPSLHRKKYRPRKNSRFVWLEVELLHQNIKSFEVLERMNVGPTLSN